LKHFLYKPILDAIARGERIAAKLADADREDEEAKNSAMIRRQE